MANPEHVEIVRQGAEAIKGFREKNRGVRTDLSGADLRRANLSDANLSGAELYGADLSDAKLSGADLTRADLSDANLSFANLSGAELYGADLSDACLLSASLRHADLTRANLSDANLSHANLSGACLICADLSGANLSDASLIDADLSSDNLIRANLIDDDQIGANLCDANLISADLSGANLSSAALIRANLIGATLIGANLSYAKLRGTIFGNIDLSQAKGLESVKHLGPSIIGVDTLFLSNGKIPEIFLRGCGLPDEFIAYVPSLVGNAFEFYSCFISYNHEDKQFARQLHDRLQGRGIRCWLDEKKLNPGDDLYHGIDRGIRVWDKVSLCASKHSLKSWWVDNEITIALERERELSKSTKVKPLKIIPLNLDGYMFKDYWKSGHRAMLRKRVAADFRNWKTDADKFDREFERVVKALKTDGGKLPEPKLPKPPK